MFCKGGVGMWRRLRDCSMARWGHAIPGLKIETWGTRAFSQSRMWATCPAAFTLRLAGLLQSPPRVHLEARGTSGKVRSRCDLPM
jgi:hypothetical protein